MSFVGGQNISISYLFINLLNTFGVIYNAVDIEDIMKKKSIQCGFYLLGLCLNYVGRIFLYYALTLCASTKFSISLYFYLFNNT